MVKHGTRNGALAIDIGNTKVHGQIRDAKHRLIEEWKAPTRDYTSLVDIVEQGFARAKQALAAKPDIVGLGFGGAVDKETGAVKLAFVPEFQEITLRAVQALLGGVPVIHLNDVEAAAYLLVSPYFTPSCTSLSPEPILRSGSSVLIEIGTGVGTACALSSGVVSPSEAHWVPASDGTPHVLRLSGDHGFHRIIDKLHQLHTPIPPNITNLLNEGKDLGPAITKQITKEGSDKFAQAVLNEYAARLGEYCGLVQLCFLATSIYISGSVGRAPGFLDKVVANEVFWEAFVKEGAFRGKDMPIFRIDDTDTTVRGIYTAAMNYLSNSQIL